MKAALLGRSLLLAVVMGMTCTSGLATAGSLHPAVAAAVERAQSAAQRGRDAFIEVNGRSVQHWRPPRTGDWPR